MQDLVGGSVGLWLGVYYMALSAGRFVGKSVSCTLNPK